MKTRARLPLAPTCNVFAMRYGNKTVPPAVFVKHQLVTAENVDHGYPNDDLIQLPVGGPS